MSNFEDDPMWSEFEPLWTALQGAAPGILVAGGYGLFLKQRWLTRHRDVGTVVGLADWPDATPRVTKDLDLVLGLEVIASAERQATVSRALATCGFTIRNPRLVFEKRIGNREMVVDLHAPIPSDQRDHVTADHVRVKHDPSLGDDGVHGRPNAEAAGCDLHPFQFEINGLHVAVPNPVTWSVMKLTAMRDRWARAEDPTLTEATQQFHREQAVKHALDICRVVAMVTLEERDQALEVVHALKTARGWAGTAGIVKQFFLNPTGKGIETVRRQWRPDDLNTICQLLESWFG